MIIYELLDGLRLLKAQTQPVVAFGPEMSDKLYGAPRAAVFTNAHRCAESALTYIKAAEKLRIALEGVNIDGLSEAWNVLNSIARDEEPETGSEIDLP